MNDTTAAPVSLPPSALVLLPLHLRPLAFVEVGLGWLLKYPLLTFQIVLFWLIAWGGLGTDLGLDDLFWHEDPVNQFVVGLSVGLLFEQVLFLRYLLGQRRSSSRALLTLFPAREVAVRRLGQFLLISWLLCTAVLVLPKFYSVYRAQERAAEAARVAQEAGLKVTDAAAAPVPEYGRYLPMVAGLGTAFVVSLVLVAIGEWLGLRAFVQRSLLFRLSPGVAWGFLAAGDHPLHGLAVLLGLLFGAGVAVAAGLHAAGYVLVTPYLVLCLILGVVNSVYGFLASHLRGLQLVGVILLVLSAVLLNSNLIDPDHAYRMSFPHMGPYYDAVREAAHQTEVPPGSEYFIRLDEEQSIEKGQVRRFDYYRQLHADKAHSAEAAGLIDSEKPLQAMAERWEKAHPGQKPRVVIVCTSGGGIRAAVWTAVVLEGLEETVPGLRDNVRLITGASGGMVGAGLYVADFERKSDPKDIDPETGLGTFSRVLATDSLSPTVQTMLLSDLPGIWIPTSKERDRGRELEEAWFRHTKRSGEERSAFEKSFHELRETEARGLRPSLVYVPMLVEDSRRLIISNLDLDHLTISFTQQLGGSSFAEGGTKEDDRDPQRSHLRTMRALSAIEFFRLFPQATGFQVSTAARMNASFPLVSPAVNLPTYPPRRVVDAGYYDNYGPNVATLWLLRHQEALRKYTSGVLLIEIHAYRNGYKRRHFQDKEKKKALPARETKDPEDQPKEDSKDLVSQSIEGLATPAEAMLTARDRAALYRNDELLEIVDRQLNRPEDRNFFTTVAFECNRDAALSWMLPKADRREIAAGFWEKPDHSKLQENIERRVALVKQWFGDGGR